MFSVFKINENTTVIKVRDDDLLRTHFVDKESFHFEGADLTQIRDVPVSVNDINQTTIGNCYFVATLGAILASDPLMINNIIKINKDHMIEVTFYDSQDLNKKYIYILEPSKIVNSHQKDAHNHDSIDMLEKAFAIHRAYTCKNTYAAEEVEIINFYKQFGAEENRQEVYAKYFEKYPHMTANFYIIDKVIDKYKKDYTNYIAALTEGEPAYVFATLLGTTPAILKLIRSDFDFFKDDILQSLRCDKMDWHTTTKDFIIQIFGELNSEEVDYFHQAIQNTPLVDLDLGWEQLIIYNNGLKDKLPKEELLKQYLRTSIRWGSSNEHLKNKVIANLETFIDKEIFHSRGMHKYTKRQEEVYQKIYEALRLGSMITVRSPSGIGRNGIKYHKGIYANHTYQIVNCYERGNHKFLLIRNPHGNDSSVRDYHVDKSGRMRAREYQRTYVENLGVIPSTSPRRKPVKNAATKSHHSMKNGFFELEISDLKNFVDLTIALAKHVHTLEPKR